MASDEIRSTLRTFLGGFIRAKQFTDADNIFKSGFVNSLFVMQLILYVESTYGLTVENEDMDIANFCSIDALTQFISAKIGAQPAVEADS